MAFLFLSQSPETLHPFPRRCERRFERPHLFALSDQRDGLVIPIGCKVDCLGKWRCEPIWTVLLLTIFYMGASKNRGTPKWMVYNGTLSKWMIWGYPYFWKHPYNICITSWWLNYPFEIKWSSNWIISSSRGENEIHLKPPPRLYLSLVVCGMTKKQTNKPKKQKYKPAIIPRAVHSSIL